MELLIIRHARPIAETRSEGEGSADPPLSPIGVKQAEATAEFLKDQGIQHVVSSTMTRAIQTAEPFSKHTGLKIEMIDDLKEADFDRNSYTPVEEMDPDHPFIKEYLEDPESIFGGDLEGFRKRTTNAFNYLIEEHKGSVVAVFCHGMVMGVFLQSILEHDNPVALQPDYCGITRVTASSSGLRSIRSINETSHVRHLLD
ncbi:MAG: histidine phosphatase family protein [Acidimicrobiales bacterium]|jgi:probable phosphoglycerate mutase|nr:histidine phosphatase family protein [Acidimicrobiales bacterium]